MVRRMIRSENRASTNTKQEIGADDINLDARPKPRRYRLQLEEGEKNQRKGKKRRNPHDKMSGSGPRLIRKRLAKKNKINRASMHETAKQTVRCIP